MPVSGRRGPNTVREVSTAKAASKLSAVVNLLTHYRSSKSIAIAWFSVGSITA
jgi:hypothetical protein